MSTNIHPYNTKSESLKQIFREGKGIKQPELVFQYLLKNDTAETSRSLISKVNLERAAITRCLNTLVDEGKIYVAHIAPCPVTKRRVSWYRVVPTLGQGKLFGSV